MQCPSREALVRLPAAGTARIPFLSDTRTTLHSPAACSFSHVSVTAPFVKYFKGDTAQPKRNRKSAPDYRRRVGGESQVSLQVESLSLGHCTTVAAASTGNRERGEVDGPPTHCIWKNVPSQISEKNLLVPGPRRLRQCRPLAFWP